MNSIDSIKIDFSSEPLIIVAGIIAIAAFSIFVYRYTVPQISNTLKTFLTLIRNFALLFLLLLIFEPVLVINSRKSVDPVNLMFIDNSKSIVEKDSAARVEQINSLIDKFDEQIGDNNLIYTFGDGVNLLGRSESPNISFEDPVTNFTEIFNFISKSELNIASAVILSDGVITEGLSPVGVAEKLDIPIYTVGIGDTLIGRDIEIKKVRTNKYIYAGKPTKMYVSITNKDLGGKVVSVELSASDFSSISRTDLTLNSNGINEIELNFTPTVPGENKFTVSITQLENESSTENNSKIVYVNVLKSKLNILLLAGSPSHDVSFIMNSLKSDENLSVKSHVQLSEGNFAGDNIDITHIDSADILFLIGFPSKNTSEDLLYKVKDEIFRNKKPFFISLAEGINLQQLTNLDEILPFTLRSYSDALVNARPFIVDNGHTILRQGEKNLKGDWNNLAPILISSSKITQKSGTNILAVAKVNNIPLTSPLIIANNLGDYKSIAITGQNIWRWKLKRNDKGILFDNFFANIVKWLNTSDSQERVNITTTKKVYQLGEVVEFNAQVYDETFSPFGMADISINFEGENPSSGLKLSQDGHGFYSGAIEKNLAADYEYVGQAYFNDRLIGTDRGKFSISTIDVEKLTPNLNKDILLLLSTLTNGKYCYINNGGQIIDMVKNNLTARVREEYHSENIELWNSQIFLLLLILLFSVEWFLRKKAGMM